MKMNIYYKIKIINLIEIFFETKLIIDMTAKIFL